MTDAADGTVALDPAVDVDLDEAMALVRALATVPGHPDSVPADLPAATALLARRRPARLDATPGSPSSASGSARSGSTPSRSSAPR